MTNNPTIYGVSRDTLESLLGETTSWPSNAWLELRALLDAPAVERQDEVAFLEMELEGERRAKLELADILGVGDEPRWKWMLSAARALQSTITRLRQHKNDYMEAAEETRKALTTDIARLEARITQLESEAEFAAATYQAARDRIAELESGRGEPFFYGIIRPDGKPHYSELCVSGEASDLESEAESWTEDGDGVYRVVPLFTAPSAPVAAQDPDIIHDAAFRNGVMHGYSLGSEGSEEDYQKCISRLTYALNAARRERKNACLDATAALNKSP